MPNYFRVAAVIAFAAALLPSAVQAQSPYEVIYSFNRKSSGVSPQGVPVVDRNGVLYGTTPVGGETTFCASSGCGTVFSLTPPAKGQTRWKYTVLHAFTAKEGGFIGDLVMDKTGVLFGVMGTDDVTGFGAVFTLTPPAAGADKWKFDIIYRFQGPPKDVDAPTGLIFDSSGALYGASFRGGSDDKGGVFRLNPPSGKKGWTSTIIHNFSKDSSGTNPVGRPTFDEDGNLYGTTGSGGSHDAGTIWRLTKPAPGKNSWHYDVLHQFRGFPDDGTGPQGALLLNNGVFYGTTFQGGSRNDGTLFKLTKPKSANDKGEYETLHDFDAATDGTEIYSDLASDNRGRMYGVTLSGSGNDGGTLYRLSPPKAGTMKVFKFEVLYRFLGRPDASNPRSGVVRGEGGVLYGTTTSGGAHGVGAIFSFNP